MNAQIRSWLDEAVEVVTAVEVVEEYVSMTDEQAVELERIEAVEWEEFWVEWRRRREEEIEEKREEEEWDRLHWEALEVETIRQIIEADRE